MLYVMFDSTDITDGGAARGIPYGMYRVVQSHLTLHVSDGALVSRDFCRILYVLKGGWMMLQFSFYKSFSIHR
jgi:hypothetical protein